MPLVTITVRKGKSPAFKRAVLDAIHAALVSSGVPATDRFQRAIELDADSFVYDATYPDVKTQRTDDFVLVEILWSAGRSVKVKRKLLDEMIGLVSRAGVDPENLMVVFKETTWENWAFAGGRQIHV